IFYICPFNDLDETDNINTFKSHLRRSHYLSQEQLIIQNQQQTERRKKQRENESVLTHWITWMVGDANRRLPPLVEGESVDPNDVHMIAIRDINLNRRNTITLENANDNRAYHLTYIVGYLLPVGSPDRGPKEMFERNKLNPEFRGFIFVDSAVIPRACTYHTDVRSRERSPVFKHARAGYKVYSSTIVFNGRPFGESVQMVINEQLKWVNMASHQTVVNPAPGKMFIRIANQLIVSKFNKKSILTDAQSDEAYRTIREERNLWELVPNTANWKPLYKFDEFDTEQGVNDFNEDEIYQLEEDEDDRHIDLRLGGSIVTHWITWMAGDANRRLPPLVEGESVDPNDVHMIAIRDINLNRRNTITLENANDNRAYHLTYIVGYLLPVGSPDRGPKEMFERNKLNPEFRGFIFADSAYIRAPCIYHTAIGSRESSPVFKRARAGYKVYSSTIVFNGRPFGESVQMVINEQLKWVNMAFHQTVISPSTTRMYIEVLNQVTVGKCNKKSFLTATESDQAYKAIREQRNLWEMIPNRNHLNWNQMYIGVQF
ncbi:hypothetical protein Fcan01_02833, partial [Folsomia candida]